MDVKVSDIMFPSSFTGLKHQLSSSPLYLPRVFVYNIGPVTAITRLLRYLFEVLYIFFSVFFFKYIVLVQCICFKSGVLIHTAHIESIYDLQQSGHHSTI